MAEAKFEEKLSGLRVLVVDDSRMILKLVPVMLGQLGIARVDTATQAAEAEEMIAAQNYDIVFLDGRMPGKSGLVFLEECRAKPAHQNIAFVFLSGGTDQKQIDAVLRAGAAEYIVKPFNIATLKEKMAAVTAWLEARGRFSGVAPS